jgi:hypothetical protein
MSQSNQHNYIEKYWKLCEAADNWYSQLKNEKFKTWLINCTIADNAVKARENVTIAVYVEKVSLYEEFCTQQNPE